MNRGDCTAHLHSARNYMTRRQSRRSNLPDPTPNLALARHDANPRQIASQIHVFARRRSRRRDLPDPAPIDILANHEANRRQIASRSCRALANT